MARDVETILSEMRANLTGVTFSEACKVGDYFFSKFGKAEDRGQPSYLQDAPAGRSQDQHPEGRSQGQTVSGRADD